MISDVVTSIGAHAFDGCTGLIATAVDKLNASYSSLDGVLFNKNQTTLIKCPERKAVSYTIPDSVTSIGEAAFSGCTGLTSVIIGDSLTSIGDSAFEGCTSLETVYFRGDAPEEYPGPFAVFPAMFYHLPGTTGWWPTFGYSPTALWIPLTLGDPPLTTAGPLRLRSASPAPATVRVQRSTNLRDWEDWQTVSRDQGPSELQDSEAGAVPYMFYRMVEE